MSVVLSLRDSRRAKCAALVFCLLSCVEPARPPAGEARAEFGIFYGGQVQERQEIPFEIDASKQMLGFRVQLSPPPREALDIRWELGMPGAGRPRRDSQGRLSRPRKTLLGQARWRIGEATFEQPLQLEPGEPLGLWNIRVLIGGRVVLDRPFVVYDAIARKRNAPAPFESDAGY